MIRAHPRQLIAAFGILGVASVSRKPGAVQAQVAEFGDTRLPSLLGLLGPVGVTHTPEWAAVLLDRGGEFNQVGTFEQDVGAQLDQRLIAEQPDTAHRPR